MVNAAALPILMSLKLLSILIKKIRQLCEHNCRIFLFVISPEKKAGGVPSAGLRIKDAQEALYSVTLSPTATADLLSHE
jgi:hypothetical protein